jgi:hypothetical protein
MKPIERGGDGGDDAMEPLVPWMPLAVCAGIGAALGLHLVPLLSIAASGLTTLVHEFGHAVGAWTFARGALPAFDFQHGGGVTAHTLDRSWFFLLAIWGLLGVWIYSRRRNPPAMGVAIGVTALHALIALTSTDFHVAAYAGHGGTVVFAGIFLYRFLSGAAVAHEQEQWLYGILACFLLFDEVRLCGGILFDTHGVRAMYLSGKGGIAHDFDKLGRWMLGLDAWALFHIAVTCATGAAVVAAWHQREWTGPLLSKWFGAGEPDDG